MHRVDATGHYGNTFTDGGSGIEPTTLDAKWHNAVQEEIANVIEFTGDTLSAADNTQLLTNLIPHIPGATALRAIAPVNGYRVYLQYHTTAGDGGHGVFRGVTGAAAATYTHDNSLVVVPSGGDGSAAWLRDYAYPIDGHWDGGLAASRAEVTYGNAGTTLTQITYGPSVGQARIWAAGGVIGNEIGDGVDMAGFRYNGTQGAASAILAQEHIVSFYGSGMGNNIVIPTTTYNILYSSYDGENVHTNTGAGVYSAASVSYGGEGDYAVFANNSATNYISSGALNWTLLVKDTDYTVDTGAQTVTLLSNPGTTYITIRRRRAWAGSGPFLGRSGDIAIHATAAFTNYSRPSTMIFGVCQENEVVHRPRMFMKDASIVMMGRGSHEDVTSADYPDNINVGNDSYKKWKGFQGSVFPDTYTPKGVLDIWSSTISDTATFNGRSKAALAAIAIRKGTDPNNTGFDIGHHHSDAELIFYTVASGTRTKSATWAASGSWSIATAGGKASLVASPITNATSNITIKGSTGDNPYIQATGTNTNIDLKLGGQGAGVIQYNQASTTAGTPSNFSAAEYITIKDSSGTVLYIPVSLSAW